MSTQHVQGVLLLLVLALNSTQFRILQLHTLALAARSHALLLYIVCDVHDEGPCAKYLLCRLEGRRLLPGTFRVLWKNS